MAMKRNGLQKMRAFFEDLTAQGINDFQKTLFPVIFIIFLIPYVLAVQFKWGDIPPQDMND